MSYEEVVMPGGGVSKRPLHFIVLADCSGSMKADGKMQALNYSIASIISMLESWENEQDIAEVFVRVIGFADNAFWHIPELLPIKNFSWPALNFVEKGLTSMGAAFKLVATVLKPDQYPKRALRPLILLITDGQPTDIDEYDVGLKELLSTPAGNGAIRMAIAIGRLANYSYLERFINNPALPVLVADHPEQILTQLTKATLAMSKLVDPGADRGEIIEQVLGTASTRSEVNK